MPDPKRQSRANLSNRHGASHQPAGNPAIPPAAARETHPRSGDQQTGSNPAPDIGAASCDSSCGHRSRGIGKLIAEFIPATSCGLHSNGLHARLIHSSSGITLKVMRRRGGRWFN